MPKLILFDIDGTLVHTGGAGLRAIERSLAHLLGLQNALRGVSLAGRTDRGIIEDLLARLAPDHVADEAWLLVFRDLYVRSLAEELEADDPGKCVLPGAREAVAHLEARDDVRLALLTGNIREGAQVKLSYFGLWDAFPFGAFGGDVADRNLLFPVAVAEAHARGIDGFGPHDVIVIGDTPFDVECARSGGGVAVGVATGPFSAAQLAAAGADIVLEDLRDLDGLMQAFEVRPRGLVAGQ